MKTYKLRPGFSIGVPVEQAAAHLEAMKEANGDEIDPAMVVEDAKRPDSPIHDCFTWDVRKAAHAHWLATARYLIRSYDVEVISETKTVVISPASVRVITSDKRSVYVSTPTAMSQDDYRRHVLGEARGLLNGVAERIRKLEGLSPKILSLLHLLDSAIAKEIERKKVARKVGSQPSDN